MPREALSLGANIVVARVGSGAYFEDFPIPDMYRVNPFDFQHTANVLTHIIQHPVEHEKYFHEARQLLKNEKENFDMEVLFTFSQFL